MTHLTPADLDVMGAGLEGVTPGFDRWIWLLGDEIIYTRDPSDGVRTHGLVRRHYASNDVMAHIARCDPATIRELIRLARIGLASDGMGRVKDLEWNVNRGFSADTPFGAYEVEPHGAVWHMLHGGSHLSSHPTEDEAKAVAQADFTTRILSTLDTSTTPASVEQSEGEPVGWETKAEWELEQRAFHWNPSWSEEETRKLIGDLWRQYCFAAAPTKPAAVTAGVVTDAMVDEVLEEMLRRTCLEKHIYQESNPDWLPVDDTQIGVEFACEYLRKALSAQPQAVNVPEGWASIETAPKDGTEIIICGGEVMFSEGYDDWKPTHEAHVARWDTTWDRWLGDNGDEYGSHWLHRNPTLWMPFPASPTHQPMNALDQPGSEEGGVK